MEFFEKVFRFLMGEGVEKHMIFGTSSAIVGLLIVILDCAYFLVKKKSLLFLSYRGFRAIFVIVIWGFGAGLVGLIGGAINILQENLQACIVVGIGWPAIFPRIIESASSREETQVATKEE